MLYHVSPIQCDPEKSGGRLIDSDWQDSRAGLDFKAGFVTAFNLSAQSLWIISENKKMALKVWNLAGANQTSGGFSASEMTYIVSGGALNSTHSLTGGGLKVSDNCIWLLIHINMLGLAWNHYC